MCSDVLRSIWFSICLGGALVLVAGGGCNSRVFAEGASSDGGEESGDDGFDPELPDDPEWPDASCGNGVVDPGEFCHEQGPELPAGIDPCALAVADFDGDGRPDAAVPNSDFENQEASDHVVNVLMGKGDGDWLSRVAHAAGGPLPVGIDAGDFDGDGNPDLIVANWQGFDVNLLRGDGAGGFAAPVSIPVGESADSVSAGDIDLDGRSDIVVATATRSAVAVIRGFADAPALVEWIELGSAATHATFADIDHDGAPELIATAANQVLVGAGYGDGSFGPAVGYEVNFGPTWVFVDDIDEDGHFDLLVTNSDGTLDILRGDGAGSFAPASNLALGHLLQSVTQGDFDMDGHPDVAVSDEGQDAVIFAVGLGPEGFAEKYTFPVGRRPVSIRRADFNLDGVVDVAVANQYSNTVSVIASNP